MMRSLYAGVSGLRNHQTRMDVIGNNIANVNTIGFKRNRVSFQDMLYQSIRGASAPAGTLGGTNPSQVGLGVNIATIDTIHTQGSTQTTGKMTDLMLQGDGFFVLADSAGNNPVYTRAGNFELDAQGYLVNPANGMYVMNANGARIFIDPANNPQSLKIDTLGNVSYINGTTGATVPAVLPDPNFQIRLAKFNNYSGLEKIGDNLYKETNNSGLVINTYAGDTVNPNGLVNTRITPGALEMSNVDLSQEFTDMIITQRGFQANSRIITVSDEMLQELVNLKR